MERQRLAPRIVLVLDLDPCRLPATAVGRIQALGDDAFLIVLNDDAKQRFAVRIDVLDDLTRRTRRSIDPAARPLPHGVRPVAPGLARRGP